MGVKCPVCQYENADESILRCDKCGEDLVSTGSWIEKPIKMLREMGQKVVESSGSMSKEKLESLYFHIVELLQDALDESKEQIEAKMENLRKDFARTSRISEEDVELKGFVESFHRAQTSVNEGIGMALGALMNMRNFRDIPTGQQELELAVARIQEGFENIQQLEAVASGMPLPHENTPEVPVTVVLAMDSISKALEALNGFMQQGSPDQIRLTLSHLDEARGSLANYLESAVQPHEAETLTAS